MIIPHFIPLGEKNRMVETVCRYFGKYKPITEPVSAQDSRSVMYERELNRKRQMDRKKKVKGTDREAALGKR